VLLQKIGIEVETNYRGASKEGHRGEIINIVAHQKMDIVVKS
jgi:hypothetical protein